MPTRNDCNAAPLPGVIRHLVAVGRRDVLVFAVGLSAASSRLLSIPPQTAHAESTIGAAIIVEECHLTTGVGAISSVACIRDSSWQATDAAYQRDYCDSGLSANQPFAWPSGLLRNGAIKAVLAHGSRGTNDVRSIDGALTVLEYGWGINSLVEGQIGLSDGTVMYAQRITCEDIPSQLTGGRNTCRAADAGGHILLFSNRARSATHVMRMTADGEAAPLANPGVSSASHLRSFDRS